jgi:hypothetical protein
MQKFQVIQNIGNSQQYKIAKWFTQVTSKSSRIESGTVWDQNKRILFMQNCERDDEESKNLHFDEHNFKRLLSRIAHCGK